LRTKFLLIVSAFRIKGTFVPVCNFQDEYIKTAAVMIAENKKNECKNPKKKVFMSSLPIKKSVLFC